MEKIALITDSASDLSKEFIEENNIFVVNLYVIINENYYQDRVDISPNDIAILNEKDSKFKAKSSAPSPADFSKVFKEVKDKGYKKAIYIGLNPKLSASFSNANLAEKYDLDVRMVNSGSVTLLEGLIVLYAVDLIKENYELDTIVEELSLIHI